MTQATTRLSVPTWAPKAYLVSSIFAASLYLILDQMFVPFTGLALLKASGILFLALYALLKGHTRLCVALGLSACGDYALALGPSGMTAGIAFFACAHLFYLSIFVGQILGKGWAKDGLVLAFVLFAYGAAMLWWLRPDMGSLALPATIYNGIILLMAMSAAVSGTSRLALTGALCFVISDSMLAARMFKGVAIWDYGWDWGGMAVWITYFMAQIYLTLGLTDEARKS